MVRIVYHTAADSTVLASRHWRPAEPARGTVVLLHGIVSHGGWYEATGQALATCGYNVHVPDRRGSGLNSAVPGGVKHWSVWRDEVRDYLEWIDQNPVVLCGISWGAKLAAVAAATEPEAIAGLALINPGICAYQTPNAATRAALEVSRFLPIDRRLLDIPLNDPALFTESPDWREYIARDPLARRTMTVREAREDLALTERALNAASALTVPVLLVLSGKDRITDNEATPLLLAHRLRGQDRARLSGRGAYTRLRARPRALLCRSRAVDRPHFSN